MASFSSAKRSNDNSKITLFGNDSTKAGELGDAADTLASGGASIQRSFEKLSLSGHPRRNVSKSNRFDGLNSSGKEKRAAEKHSAFGFGCLNVNIKVNIKGGGCRVGVCEELDLSPVEDCMQCSAAADPLRKKNSRKEKEIEQCQNSSDVIGFSLPDDILEMVFVRLPLTSLMAARCVCKKWRNLMATPHFMQMRSRSLHRSPWLFLFGITGGGSHAGEIHVLDVSLNQWYKISDDILKGRFLFSVAGVGSDLYIVGGCSKIGDLSVPSVKESLKRHKSVVVFSPLAGSWRKAAPMRTARSAPILGVFEVSPSCSIFQSCPMRQEQLRLKSRLRGISDVYGDPHRFSLRRQPRDASSEDEDSLEHKTEPCNFAWQENNDQMNLALIAVGGLGSWDEPLDTGEIYDPKRNRWIEIMRLPGELGPVCSGTVCHGKFYVYSEVDKLASYDLERGFWITIQTFLPPPRLPEYYPKIVSCKNRLFMLSVSWCNRHGQLNARERAVRRLLEIDLGCHTWTEVARHPDAPMDRNAVFVADRDRIYGVEMFKIFGQVLDFLTSCYVSDTELKWNRIAKDTTAAHKMNTSYLKKLMAVLHL